MAGGRGESVPEASMSHLYRCLLALLVVVTPAVAQQGTPETTPPVTAPPLRPLNVTRYVPTGEERTIGFMFALLPDCSSRGPVVGRIIEMPSHGSVNLVAADSFPTFPPGNLLAVCNDKKNSWHQNQLQIRQWLCRRGHDANILDISRWFRSRMALFDTG